MKKIISLAIVIILIISFICCLIPSLYGREISKILNNDYIDDCCCNYVLSEDIGIYSQNYYLMKKPIDCSNLDVKKPSQVILDTPDEFNWMDVDGVDWTTIAKNQQNCGCCWDFAALGALESRIMIEEKCSKLKPDLSEQYVLSCLPASANNYGQGCYGGTPYNAYYYILNETGEGNYYNGIMPETCFPYQASHDIPCEDKCDDWLDYLIPISDCEEFFLEFEYNTLENRNILKSIIFEDGPVAVALNVTQDFVDYWNIHHSSDDYYPDTNEPWGNRLNHIVTIVGWKDDPSIDNGGYWIVKNSWGTYWGYNGFFNLEYGALFIAMYYATVDYDPESFDWDPVADAGGMYKSEVGEIITFDGSNSIDAEGEIISYEWDFGDGETSEGSITNHSYGKDGIYVVRLSVTDSMGNIGIDTTLIGIGQEPINIDVSGFIGINLSVENPSDAILSNIEWNADIQGLILHGNSNGVIQTLLDNEVFYRMIYLFGIGFGSININVENIEKTEKFLVLGPFVFGLNLQ